MGERYYATGRRKTSISRVWLEPGQGTFEVNNRTLDDFFGRETLKMIVHQPFEVTDTRGRFNVCASVRGGGMSGQAGAIKHGISKAILEVHPEYREALKRAGFLTRDPRVKERKKYGKRGARASFQYSKR